MLEALKDEVIRYARQAQRDGLCKHRSGNFSMRDPESGLIVITPTGVDRELLKTDDMVVMDMNSTVVENLTGLRPTSEYLMHRTIYEERPDARAVAHTHSMYATALACMNRAIPPLVYEMFIFHCEKGLIPIAPYGRPGTPALAEAIRELVRTNDALLLKNHGVVTFDSGSMDDTYLKAQYVEEFAKMYLLTLAAGGGREPDLLPAEELHSWAYPEGVAVKHS